MLTMGTNLIKDVSKQKEGQRCPKRLLFFSQYRLHCFSHILCESDVFSAVQVMADS